MEFKISKELIKEIAQLIQAKNNKELEILLNDMHHADFAEILDEIDIADATYIFKVLDSEKTAEILLELEDDLREKILNRLSPKEIAEELDELETNDAADIIGELSKDRKAEVISELQDVEHAKGIVDLLRYDEDTAGGIMHKELVKVNENWNVLTCVKEMRIQAENVSRVHSIYVVDDENRLKGRLSLKDLLTTSTKTQISDIYIRKLYYVNVETPDVEVARMMDKYDLEAIPVVDELGRLVGRITIDDIIDVIKDEIEKRDTEDIQKFGGLEALELPYVQTRLGEMVKKRATWLVVLFIGEMFTASAMGFFEGEIEKAVVLALFVPLIISSGGNSGSQAATLIIRAMALKELTLKDWWYVMKKEIASGFLLGAILGIVGFIRILVWQQSGLYEYGEHWLAIGMTVSLSLVFIVLWGTLSGSMIPFLLKKLKLDPATSSAPFVATLVDVTGLVIYFTIASLLLKGKLL
ncbi:magnesium transporter [Flavobacterium plurextorum]|uniref:Magnesium transporter MgtE n=1 Tax=Flavobacterium plurextorum TaxID=1114867 RepID=A0ABX4CX86_9FLAO|nr:MULTISPECIES: magnesium transporter [Flavobacterium]OXB09708.1 magnesium transporter [Flavobacterium plurextorum]PIF69921.1 magnesium transporter [Flavobacterium sp. 2]UUW09968.1 magnesium transporter [Flavobacterium plurextorum]